MKRAKPPAGIIRLATRGSRLALAQAGRAADAIRRQVRGVTVELVPVKTTGDRIPNRPLAEFGDKAVFVREIEDAILGGRADAGVHSLKDLPADLPKGLRIGSVVERGDVREALVSRNGLTLERLRPGAVVGTSSLRRQGQILNARGDLRVQALRGNVETRLAHLAEGRYDAIVVAAAGLERLGLLDRATELLDPAIFVPAAGQGAIVLEVPTRSRFRAAWDAVDDARARLCVEAERAFTRAVGADCNSSVACWCRLARTRVTFIAGHWNPDGCSSCGVVLSAPKEEARRLARDAAGLVAGWIRDFETGENGGEELP